jgi:hypothetical protein
MTNLEAYYDYTASIPAPGECFCHLMAGHPHAGINEMCDVCISELAASVEAPASHGDGYPPYPGTELAA